MVLEIRLKEPITCEPVFEASQMSADRTGFFDHPYSIPGLWKYHNRSEYPSGQESLKYCLNGHEKKCA